MAALDDLLARVSDPQLREELAREIAPLRAEQQLGLVFERHLPESARLYGHPVRRGLSVQMRNSDSGPTWSVVRVSAGQATLRRVEDGEVLVEEHPVDDLVVVREFGEAIYPGLRSEGRVERGGDRPWHLAIQAENYHALEALLYTCEGQVDAIYIDPPYNTGAKDWKYNNDYVDDGDRNRHSKWLSFMEKRLLLAKRLLNPDNSVLIVTIDEKEVHRLGLLIHSVFPGCPTQMATIVINPLGQARRQELARVEEYAFFVFLGEASPAGNSDDLLTDATPKTRTDVRWEWLLRGGTHSERWERPNLFYPVYINPDTKAIAEVGEPLPADAPVNDVPQKPGLVAVLPVSPDGREGNWRCSAEYLRSLAAQGYARVGAYNKKQDRHSLLYLGKAQIRRVDSGELRVSGRDANGVVLLESQDDTASLTAKTVWNRLSHRSGDNGTALVKKLLAGRAFPFPKSLYAVEDALRLAVGEKSDALVVDFFAGSGTTAHAVARLNKQDGGNRRSIVVSNNEVSPDEAKKLREAGHLPGDAEWEAQGIFQHITAPRIRAAITGQTPGGEPVKGDYKFTDEFPMADGFEENVEFFTLTYEDPDVVRAGAGFTSIAPLLWLKAGAQGPRIDTVEGSWSLPDGGKYAVLFNTDDWAGFAAAINEAAEEGRVITHAFITTNSDAVFTQIAADLPPETEPVRLYEDYLTSFAINTGGAA